MASPLRTAAAMLKRHAPAALCFNVDLTRQAFVAGAMRAVAGGEGLGLLAPVADPDFSLEIFPPSMAKLVPEGFQAIPISEMLYQGVPALSPSQNSHRFLLGGVAVTGMILLAEGSEGNSEKPEDVLARQTAGVVELLKQQLEKSGQIEAENQKLKQEASSRDRQLSHDLQIEITRQAHEEAMAEYRLDEARLELEKLRMKTDEKQGGDGDKGSGSDKKPEDDQNKHKPEGDKNKSKNEDKEALYKKIFRYFMAPSTADTLIKAVEDNWVKWTQIGGLVSLALGCSRSEWVKVFRGEFKRLDPRIEVVEMRTCPCGLPWPEFCFKCGRGLPAFVSVAAGPISAAPVGRDGTPTVAAGSSVSKKGPAN